MSTNTESNYTYIVAESVRKAQRESNRELRPNTPEYSDLMQNIDFAVQQILQNGEAENGCKKHLNTKGIKQKQENSNKKIKPRNPQFNDLLQNIEFEVQEALAEELKMNDQ